MRIEGIRGKLLSIEPSRPSKPSREVIEWKAQIAYYDNQLRQAEKRDQAWRNRRDEMVQDAEANLLAESNIVDKSKRLY